MRRSSFATIVAGLCLALAFPDRFAAAQSTFTWDATAGTTGPQDGGGTWSTSASGTNWWDGTTNVAWSSGNIATFGAGGTAGTVTVSGSVNVAGLAFGNIATGSAGPRYTLSSGTIGFTDNGTISLSGSSGLFNAGVNIGSRLIAHNLSVTSSGPFIPNGSQPQAVGLILGGSNTITGTLSLSGPVLLGSPTAVTQNSVGTAVIDVSNGANFSGGSSSYTNDFRIAGNGSGRGAIRIQTNATGLQPGGIYSGSITLTGSAQIWGNSGHNATFLQGFGETAGGSKSLEFQNGNGGTLFLLGVSSYTGTTSVTAGSVVLDGGNNTLSSQTVLSISGSGSRLVLGGTANGAISQTVSGLISSQAFASVAGGHSSTSTLIAAIASGTNTFAGILGGTAANANNLALQKSGAGTLTLTGTQNTYTGATTISGGTLSVSSDANLGTAPGAATAGQLVIDGGALSASAGFTLNSNRGIALGPSSGSGSGTINVASGTLTSGGIVANNGAGVGGLVKTGAGTLTLSGSNSYSGGTTLSAGQLNVDNPSALGASTGSLAVNGGTLDLRGNSVTVGLLTGSAGATITSGVAGSVILTASSATSGTYAGVISNGSGTVSLNKAGDGTLVLGGANAYTGATTVSAGTLALGATQSLAGLLVLGGSSGAATVGNVDLTSASGTFGGLTVQTLTSNTNVITVGSGRTLATNGNVAIGSNVLTGTTNLRVAGATAGVGGWSITNTQASGSFQVGVTGASLANTVTVDLSSLGTFVANLSGATSAFRVGSNSASSPGGKATMTLAVSSTITAKTIGIGDISGEGATHTLLLGSGAQRFNTDKLVIGNATTTNSGRAGGLLQFAGPTGSLVLRGTDGTGRTDITMVSGGAVTGANPGGTIDLRGHDADLLVGTLTMSALTGENQIYNSAFSFDQGTLDVTAITMGSKSITSSGTRAPTATVNLGSSTNSAVNTSTIGSIAMASHSGTSGTINAVMNVAGANTAVTVSGSWLVAANFATSGAGVSSGTVNISGGTVNANQGMVLRSGSGFGTVNGTLAITGGALTSGGDITSAGTFAAGAATLTLNGGRLDMGGFAIGGAGQTITANLQSGTLAKVGEFNAGAGLTKTSSGTLTLSGSSGYTGGTTLSAGRLVVGSSNALGPPTNPLRVNAGTLDLLGNSLMVGLLTGSSGATITSSVANAILNAASASSGTFGGVINDGAGGMAFTKGGVGTLTLDGANSYAGDTLIDAGSLRLGAAGSIASSRLIRVASGASYDVSSVTGYALASGQTLKGNGTIVGDMVAGAGTMIAPGGSTGLLTQTGLVTLASSGTFLFEINDVTGIAGSTSLGWDLFNVGSLSVTASSAAPYYVNLVSLGADQLPGVALNWVDAESYAWKFIDAGATIESFASNAFVLNSSAFQNSFTGQFVIARGDDPSVTAIVPGANNTELYIVYAAVPEPGAFLLAVVGIAGAAGWSRRRRHRPTESTP